MRGSAHAHGPYLPGMTTSLGSPTVRRIAAGLAMVVATGPAWANPGAAAAMASCFMVSVALVFIVAIETAILRRHGGAKSSVVWVAVANIGSTIVGASTMSSVYWTIWPIFGETVLDAAPGAAWSTLLILAVLGPLIEWPFFLLCVKGERRIRRSATALLIGSAISNSLLMVIAAVNFRHDLSWIPRTTTSELVKAHDGNLPWVYFIGPGPTDISRIRLDGTGPELIGSLPWSDPDDRWGLDDIVIEPIEQADGELRLSAVTWASLVDNVYAWRDPGSAFSSRVIGDGYVAVPIPLDRRIIIASRTYPGERGVRSFFDQGQTWLAPPPEGEHQRHRSRPRMIVEDPIIGTEFRPGRMVTLNDGLTLVSFHAGPSAPGDGLMLVGHAPSRRAWLTTEGRCPVVVYHDEPPPTNRSPR